MFMIATQAKLTHDTGFGPNGEAMPGDEARETRRKIRMESLERLRIAAEEMALRLNEGTACRLPPEQQADFARIKDPYLDFSRVALALRRIVAQQERLDEDAETRAARLAVEQAEREQMWQEQPAWADDADPALNAKKKLIRRAVRNAHQDAVPGMAHWERMEQLDDLFDEYEQLDDYDGDPAEIVATLCAMLNLAPQVMPPKSGEDEKPAAAKARAVAFAQGYLDLLAPQSAANRNQAGPAETPAPHAKGRSPPG